MKKIKPVVVEYRYNGDMPFPSWKDWRRYKSYRDTATAETAMDNLRRKYRSWEFRLRSPEGKR